MDWVGTIPQWITVAIAGGALYMAYWSLDTQKSVARKRAAIDFFLKTEMDVAMVKAHRDFGAAVDRFKDMVDGKAPSTHFDDYKRTDDFKAISSYLNVHELMSVGVLRGVLDEDVCFRFWSDELARTWKDCAPFIQDIQERPEGKHTFIEIGILMDQWKNKRL